MGLKFHDFFSPIDCSILYNLLIFMIMVSVSQVSWVSDLSKLRYILWDYEGQFGRLMMKLIDNSIYFYFKTRYVYVYISFIFIKVCHPE